MTSNAPQHAGPRGGLASAARARAESIAEAHRGDALARGHAVIVGNRAGVVEWTNAAWRRLTGFPLAETLDKPISHFLAQAGLETELVEFVAQHFLEGRRCSVALPFDTLDGRRLDLELDVEPLRSRGGEIDRFVAVLQERTPVPEVPSPGSESVPRRAPRGAIVTPPATDERRHVVQIAPLLRSAIDRACVPTETLLDVGLDEPFVPVRGRAPGAPGLAIASARVCSLVEALLRASIAQPSNGTLQLTILSGRLAGGRSHHSEAHAIPQRAVAAIMGASTFLEIHDTAPHLRRDALERLRSGEIDRIQPACEREAAYVDALDLARRLGARLFLDSTPGCGNQSLVVFDVAGAAPRASSG